MGFITAAAIVPSLVLTMRGIEPNGWISTVESLCLAYHLMMASSWTVQAVSRHTAMTHTVWRQKITVKAKPVEVIR